LIIQSLQSAWRKPINIQDGLVCDLRLTINKNGRIINSNLIKSSGNIRFDNSALNAIQRVETFNFFNNIPFSLYSSDFKNIVITFNPS
jgi:colicin import membrane protein